MPASLTTASPAGDISLDDLAAFADDFFTRQMPALQVPGAALVVVRGERILLAKGYGIASVETGKAVDADSVFRAGSVSKLVTATAVMQLVENGQIELQADVNAYLSRFHLETRFPPPVTVADLLLHTAGFEEHFIGCHARRPEDGLPLPDYLAARMPPQTTPAGSIIRYNDHTMSLAGYLVEAVSEVPFDRYVAKHIFQPLGMDASTFTQPAHVAILVRLATGYTTKRGKLAPFDYDAIHVAPAAALLTSAQDMGAFLSAHLAGGGPILAPETLEMMQATRFRNHPSLRGRAYGFSELFVNGRRTLFHDGGNPGFSSRLMLVPETGLGFFFTCNMDQFRPGGRLHRAFTTAFFDCYFPDERSFKPPQAAPGISPEPARFTGYYRDTQGYSGKTIQKLASLGNQIRVRSKPAGYLVALGSPLVPVGDHLFQWADNENFVAFREDASGDVQYLLIGTGAFQKLPWWESQPVQYGLMAFFILVFLAAAVFSLLPAAAALGPARILLAAVGSLNAVFLLGLAGAMTLTSPWEFTYGLPPPVRGLLSIPPVTIALTLALAAFTMSAWLAGDWPFWIRIWVSAVTLVSAGFFPFLGYWNLLGWRE